MCALNFPVVGSLCEAGPMRVRSENVSVGAPMLFHTDSEIATTSAPVLM